MLALPASSTAFAYPKINNMIDCVKGGDMGMSKLPAFLFDVGVRTLWSLFLPCPVHLIVQNAITLIHGF